MITCDRGIVWHGGQEGPTAEGVKLSASKKTRDRMTPCKEKRVPLLRR